MKVWENKEAKKPQTLDMNIWFRRDRRFLSSGNHKLMIQCSYELWATLESISRCTSVKRSSIQDTGQKPSRTPGKF